jgi:hypothetical protein
MKLFFVIVMVCCFAGFATAAKKVEPGCGKLLQASCQGCHNYQQICKQVGERSKRGWKKTVKRMVKNHDADITKDESNILVACLADPSPEIKKICRK